MLKRRHILTLSCRDVRGIVAAVTGFLAQHNGFILESTQFGDPSTGRFFMRVEFDTDKTSPSPAQLETLFHRKVAQLFEMDWQLHDKERRPRVILMASRQLHCLNDLMHRHSTGALPMEIAAIISNHTDARKLAQWHEIPFYHLPVKTGGELAQEKKVLKLISQYKADVVVLARYMRILSPQMTETLKGRCINIHHSFLPSFKGAKPYHQAFSRGVKIIGATAHYVTHELDEGPIIEQEIARVDHTSSPEDLVAIGRDIECVVLARALKYHIEHRVLLNGKKTVVFR